MTLRVHTPSLPFGDFIEALIYYDGINPVYQMDRSLPDGNTELIINLNETPSTSMTTKH